MRSSPARAWHAALLAALCGLACGGEPAAPPPETPPDLVLITADTLRPDHLSSSGYPRETSPQIDAFERRSWSFGEALSVIPKTGPSFATLFSGRHPLEHGVHDNKGSLPASLPWIAEILREAGYVTAAFVSNPVLHPRWGYDRGFDVYRLFQEEDALERVNREFLEWARTEWRRPVFVWLHYIDPHGPYTPPSPYADLFAGDALDTGEARAPLDYENVEGFGPSKILGAIPAYQQLGREDRVAHYVRRYDEEIRRIDDAFGEVIAWLERTGRFDEAAVMFTADHGESLGEHDYYFEHGWFAHDASLRIPLLLKPPGASEARRVDAQVSNLDLFPTLLELAGLDPAHAGEGRSLLGPELAGRELLVLNSARYPERYAGLRTRDTKYLRNVVTGEEQWFDLRVDPGETRDLSHENPPALQGARDRLDRRLQGLDLTPTPPRAPSVDPDHAEALRGLGYVD